MGFAIVQDTFTPKIGRLAILMKSPQTRQRFLMRWGQAIVKKARESTHKKAGSAFWREIRDSVKLQAEGNDAVEVGAYHVAAAQKQYGGRIKAKGKAAGGSDFLTIPVAPEAKGQFAEKFKSKNLFAISNASGSGVLGYNEESGEFHPLFALCKQTRPQRADPWWPENDFVEERGIEQANAVLGL